MDFDFDDLDRIADFLDRNPRWSVIIRRNGAVDAFVGPDTSEEWVEALQKQAEERDGG
jgi:hypothetical protein